VYTVCYEEEGPKSHSDSKVLYTEESAEELRKPYSTLVCIQSKMNAARNVSLYFSKVQMSICLTKYHNMKTYLVLN